MIRRFALLGLLGLTACPSTEEPTPDPVPKGTVKGTLTPFRSASAESARPTLLRDPAFRQRLSQSISKAVAAKLRFEQMPD